MIDKVRKYRNSETGDIARVTRHTDSFFTGQWDTFAFGKRETIQIQGTPNEVGSKLIAAGFNSRAED